MAAATAPAFLTDWAHCSEPAAALVQMYERNAPHAAGTWLWWSTTDRCWRRGITAGTRYEVAVLLMPTGVRWYTIGVSDVSIPHRGDGGPAAVGKNHTTPEWWFNGLRVDDKIFFRDRLKEWTAAVEACEREARDRAFGVGGRGRRVRA